jgi:hypothetical protein
MSLSRCRALVALLTCTSALLVSAPAHAEEQPQPGSPAYVARDVGNMADAYGRITGPGGQLTNPNYLPALIQQSSLLTAMQLLAQAATPTRPALSAGNLVPG